MVWAVSLLSDELSPAVLTAVLTFAVFVVCQEWVPDKGPIPKQSSTPANYYTTLALKLFRGEPAISGFDWHFTANHRSSKHVERCTGSVLHELLRSLQPAHG